MNKQINEKIYQTINIAVKELKKSRDYGNGHILYHSEEHLIVIIHNHRDANASELAQILGVTNGFITQIANKLSKKGLVEKYKIKGNAKDTYFRLTEQGEQVYWCHERSQEKMSAKMDEYLDSLDSDKVEAIYTFLDKMVEGVSRD